MNSNVFGAGLGISLPLAEEVGPEYFDETDREEAVAAGVRLVNGLRKFDIELDGIGVSPVCDKCTVLREAYVVELGHLTPAEAVEVATKLHAYDAEFRRMREEIKALTPAKPEGKEGAKGAASTE
ncbi:hypothetical protein EQG64_16080 [Streptomyces sp. S6]|nr:hypothetical protein EQG64_16080 [Streptomyces sp. S6]